MSKLTAQSLKTVLGRLAFLRRYSVPGFIVFVALVYGFVLFRFNTVRTIEPSETAVTSQVKAAKVPHIDQTVLQQLQSLQDNSVSVQALFNEARSNPFQ